MDELGDPIAVGFWTRESEQAIYWAKSLGGHNIKFTMTAYNEGTYTRQIVYMFRLEPIPDKTIREYLEERHGLEHVFFIYKK